MLLISAFNSVLMALSLLHTYFLLNPNATARKRNKLTRGASMDRVDSELVKRLSGKLTKDSHVTAKTRHSFPCVKKTTSEFYRVGFLFLWVLGMGYVILLWHSLSLPYNYCGKFCVSTLFSLSSSLSGPY